MNFSPMNNSRQLFISIYFLLFLVGCNSGGGSGDQVNVPSDDPPIVSTNELNVQSTSVTVTTNELGTASPEIITIGPGEVGVVQLNPVVGASLASVEGCTGELNGNEFTIDSGENDCTLFALFELNDRQAKIIVSGEGRVTSGTGDFVCEGRSTCTISINSVTDTEIFAEPNPGWDFERWVDCPVVNGNRCTLSDATATTTMATFVRDTPPVLNSDVVILDATQTSAIQSIEPGSITFSPNVPGANSWEVGQILISTDGEGFARRISQIISISNAPILVQTRPAPIEEIIDEGTLSWTADQSPDLQGQFIPEDGVVIAGGGNRKISAGISLNFVAIDADENPATTDDQLRVDLSLTGSITPDWYFDKGFNVFGANEVRIGAGTDIEAKAKFNFSLVSLPKIERTIKLGTYVFSPVVIGPLVIVPKTELFLDYIPYVDASVVVSTSVVVGGTAVAIYRRGEGWKSEFSAGVSANPPSVDNIEIKAGVKAWTGLNTKFLMYGVSGPFIKLGPVYDFSRTYAINVDGYTCATDAVQAFGLGRIGGVIDLIVWQDEIVVRDAYTPTVGVSWTQEEQDQRCFQGVYEPPQNLLATVNNDGRVDLSWETPPGAPLTKYAIHRDGALRATISGFNFQDSAVAPSNEYCYRVAGYDRNGRSSALSDSACVSIANDEQSIIPEPPTGLRLVEATPNSMFMEWDQSIDNEYVTYIVSVNGDNIAATSDSSYRLTQLQSGEQYCVALRVTNRFGIRSANTEEVCARTLRDDAAKWRMRLACVDRDYNLENRLDLQATQSGVVNIAGNGQDYDGDNLAYILSGQYNFSTQVLTGQLSWTFEDSEGVRVDLFTANLSSNDTGDIFADLQGDWEGCDAIIRFDALESKVGVAEKSRSHLPLSKISDYFSAN